MPLTDAEVRTKLRNRGISADLDDDEVDQAIAAWIEYVQIQRPIQVYGTFDTVISQQEYDLFGAGGPLEGGLEVLEIIGSPEVLDQGLDIFGVTPLLQNLGLGFGPPFNRDNYVFNVPGDFMINDRVWAAYRERFGITRFHVKESRMGSPIKIEPIPSSVKTLVVRYTRQRTDDEARADDGVLMAGAEWRALDILATKFALSAGTKIGDHEDKGTTARLFRDLADRAEKFAKELLDSRFPTTISAVERS